MDYQVEKMKSITDDFKNRVDNIFSHYENSPMKCHLQLSIAFLNLEKRLKKMYDNDLDVFLKKYEERYEFKLDLWDAQFLTSYCIGHISSLYFSNLYERIDHKQEINSILSSILFGENEEVIRLKVAEYYLGKNIKPYDVWKLIFDLIPYSNMGVPIIESINSTPIRWVPILEVKSLVFSELSLVDKVNRSKFELEIESSNSLEKVLMEFFSLSIFTQSKIISDEIRPFVRYLSSDTYEGDVTCPVSFIEFIKAYKQAFLFYLGCLSGVKQGIDESLVPNGYRDEFIDKIYGGVGKIKGLSTHNMLDKMKNVSKGRKFIVTRNSYDFSEENSDIVYEVNRYFYNQAKVKFQN